jgi:hypothetical protein
MKLYATTTSERASKGQGGNNELVISLMWENEYKERYEVAQVIFTNTKDGYNISFFDSEEEGTPRTLKETGKTKGNK